MAKINSDPICFGAKNDHYGSFNVTKTGFVKYLKLVHRHGSIRCNSINNATYWGCSNTNSYASSTFMTIITNANRQALLPSERKLKASEACNLKKTLLRYGWSKSRDVGAAAWKSFESIAFIERPRTADMVWPGLDRLFRRWKQRLYMSRCICLVYGGKV